MAKFSKKMMGKEVGSASVYAKPHGANAKAKKMQDPNSMAADKLRPGGSPSQRVSGGDPAADDVKTTGIKIRGTGAATKGLYARGPMA